MFKIEHTRTPLALILAVGQLFSWIPREKWVKNRGAYVQRHALRFLCCSQRNLNDPTSGISLSWWTA